MEDKDGYRLDESAPKSIGRMRGYAMNFGVMVRSYAYMRRLGAEGTRRVAEHAVLNANYLRVKVGKHYFIPYDRICMHEFVATSKHQRDKGIHTIDIAKRLIDLGFHPPTVYFPLVVTEAIMIEPTETESKDALDRFAVAMEQIAKEAQAEPEAAGSADHHSRAPARRSESGEGARAPIQIVALGSRPRDARRRGARLSRVAEIPEIAERVLVEGSRGVAAAVVLLHRFPNGAARLQVHQ